VCEADRPTAGVGVTHKGCTDDDDDDNDDEADNDDKDEDDDDEGMDDVCA